MTHECHFPVPCVKKGGKNRLRYMLCRSRPGAGRILGEKLGPLWLNIRRLKMEMITILYVPQGKCGEDSKGSVEKKRPIHRIVLAELIGPGGGLFAEPFDHKRIMPSNILCKRQVVWLPIRTHIVISQPVAKPKDRGIMPCGCADLLGTIPNRLNFGSRKTNRDEPV